MFDCFDWMLLHSDRLTAAIILDGYFGGPISEPLLKEFSVQATPAKTRDKALKLLYSKLKKAGRKDLINERV